MGLVVRTLVVGMLVWTAYDMAYKVFNADDLGWRTALSQGWSQLVIVAVSSALLTFTRINPLWLVLAAAVVGLVIYR